MNDQSNEPGEARPSTDQIENEIAETREHLAESVDALAAKLNVKAQAQHKVEEVKVRAEQRVAEAKLTAQHKAEEVKAQTEQKVAEAKVTAQHTATEVKQRVGALSRPAQLALLAVPVALIVLLIVRRARR